MKTGRNQPCPCGSGKKYKKCCLEKAATPTDELSYRRLSEAHERSRRNTIAGLSIKFRLIEPQRPPEASHVLRYTVGEKYIYLSSNCGYLQVGLTGNVEPSKESVSVFLL